MIEYLNELKRTRTGKQVLKANDDFRVKREKTIDEERQEDDVTFELLWRSS